jgi:hypothetical protein
MWFQQRDRGEIVSNNFQLHPPRGLDTNIFRNRCGNLGYPLYFAAERGPDGWKVTAYNESVLTTGLCHRADADMLSVADFLVDEEERS